MEQCLSLSLTQPYYCKLFSDWTTRIMLAPCLPFFAQKSLPHSEHHGFQVHCGAAASECWPCMHMFSHCLACPFIQYSFLSSYVQRMEREAGQGSGRQEHTPGALMTQGQHTYHAPQQGFTGCKHYSRRCQLVSPCCQRVFTCRCALCMLGLHFCSCAACAYAACAQCMKGHCDPAPCRLCHDEAVGSHRMDRYAIAEMVCMQCGLQQPVAGTCSGCSAQLACYYCNICHLFDDEPGRPIYHCPFCNVCR